jgi:hypothetical protein
MDAWQNEFHGLFIHFFVRAAPVETGTVVALCVLLGALVLSRIGTAMGSSRAFYSTGVLLTAAGLALLVAAMALPPFFGLDDGWMPIAAAIAALLVLVVPLTALFQKGGYIVALIAWTIALLVVGAILVLEPMVMRTFEKGVEKGHQIEKHRIEVESVK